MKIAEKLDIPEGRAMNLKLVSLEEKYRPQLTDMMEEWFQSGEKIIPYAIRKNDYHDFAHYLTDLDVEEEGNVPGSTYFCLDMDRDIFVGAVNIWHFLDQELLVDGGHIGDGVRPSERRKGIATQMIDLALEKCKELGIQKVFMICDKDNIGSAKSIQSNGGILEKEMDMDGEIVQKYCINLDYMNGRVKD